MLKMPRICALSEVFVDVFAWAYSLKNKAKLGDFAACFCAKALRGK